LKSEAAINAAIIWRRINILLFDEQSKTPRNGYVSWGQYLVAGVAATFTELR